MKKVLSAIQKKFSIEALTVGLVCIGTLAAVRLAAGYVYARRACPPNFDEAVHTIPVIQIGHDILNLDAAAFLHHSAAQEQLAHYPFLHSWLASAVIILAGLGINMTAARLVNLVFVGVSVLLTYAVARQLVPERRHKWIAGTVSAGLVLSALPLWAYGSRVYLEPIGLLLTLSALACYLASEPGRKTPTWALLTSVLVAGAFFAKYSYGIFLLAAIVPSETLHGLRNGFSLRRWLLLLAPFSGLLLLWFADADKIASFLTYTQSQNANMIPYSLEALTFYPHSILGVYALTAVSGLLMALGLLLGIVQYKEHRWRALTAYILAGLLIVTFVPQKSHRFVYTIAPVAMLLAGGAVAWSVRAIVAQKAGGLRAALLILLLAALGYNGVRGLRRLTFVSAAQEVVLACPPADIATAYQFVVDHSLKQGARPYILNPWHLYNPFGLVQTYYETAGSPPDADPQTLALGGNAPEPTEENLERLVSRLRTAGVSILVSIDGSPAGEYTGWQVVEPLWQANALTWVASDGPYAVTTWTPAYSARALGGGFKHWAEVEEARAQGRKTFSIQVHVYAGNWE